MTRLLLVCTIVVLGVCGASGSAAQEVIAGFDLWETVFNQGDTFVDLGVGSALELGLFCPGWEVTNPPDGLIQLRGVPIGLTSNCCPGENLLATDTVVQRLEDTLGLGVGPDEIPIEICELHLQSIAPITVRNALSLEVQQWSLEVLLPTLPQPIGQMTITRNDATGGTFTADLPVRARLVFTRVDVEPYVACDVPAVDINFSTAGPVNWSYAPAPGKIEVPGCTSNFFSTDDFSLVALNAMLMLTEPLAAPPVSVETTTWGRVKALYR
jgi:hypothetical protein